MIAFRRGLHGLGQISVSALANAVFNAQIDPGSDSNYEQGQTYNACGSETLAPQEIPEQYFATPGYAAQFAGLLGGSVSSGPFPSGILCGTNIPPVNYVNVDGQSLIPGQIMGPGETWSFEDECDAENYLAGQIPGGTVSATCAAGGTGELPGEIGQAGTSGSSSSSGTPAGGTVPSCASIPAGNIGELAAYCPGYVEPTPAAVPAPAPTVVPATPAVVPVTTTPATTPATSVPTAVVNSGGATQPAATTTTNTTAAATCFNPLSSWIAADTCMGPLGIIEWGLLALGAVLLFSHGGGKR
jgi:hypothetical protein